MLILRRKKNESILIGDNIRITVVESAADGVRLAIDAPKSISILREELATAEQENKGSVAPGIAAITNLQDQLLTQIKRPKKVVINTSAQEAAAKAAAEKAASSKATDSNDKSPAEIAAEAAAAAMKESVKGQN